MMIKTKILTLAMLTMTIQQGYVLGQSYDQAYSNYQEQGQGYYSNPNPAYNQGQYNIQLNEQNEGYYRGNNEGYYRGNNEGYRSNNDGYRVNNDGYRGNGNRMSNQSMRDNRNQATHQERMKNMRAEADSATPRSYPLEDNNDYRSNSHRNEDSNRRDDRNTAYRNNNQNYQNRQYISDNVNVKSAPGMGYEAFMQDNEKNKGTVLEVLSSDPSFSTLVQAITAAGLLDALSAKGPFTIFAPTNEAFKKLPADQLADLLKPENKQKLITILKYHVVPGKVLASNLVSAKVVSLQGKPLDIKVTGTKATINNANVTQIDKIGSNGVIHAIDTVLIPN